MNEALLIALVTAGLVFARMAGVLSVMPGVGANGIPTMVRMLFAIILTSIVFPHVPAYPTPPTITVLIAGMVSEIVLGVLMGGALTLVFGGLSFGMEIIGAQTGRAVALQFNPLLEVSQGPVGAMAGMMATLVFLGLDLHLLVLVILSESFHDVPPGAVTNLYAVAELFTSLMAPTLKAGLQLAGPVLTMVFLIQCFIAVLARLAPSMNVFFSIGFLLTMIAGLFLVFLSFPQLIDAHIRDVQLLIDRLGEMIAVAGEGR
ncbi:MAG: flagellar biosynthetic protein FliR [Myxococcota bacterium]